MSAKIHAHTHTQTVAVTEKVIYVAYSDLLPYLV